MQIMISILAFLIVITILVAVHEFGHLIAAKKSGVKVLCFSIGFGPKLLRCHDKSGTEYALSLIPIGGYVKMLDEAEGDVPKNQLHLAFNRKPAWKKMIIVLAGPVSNFVTAVFILWLLFMIGIKGMSPVIGSVFPNSIAAKAGLKSGQKIIAVDGKMVTQWKNVQQQILERFGDRGNMVITTENPRTHHKNDYILSLKNWEMLSRDIGLLNSLGFSPYLPPLPPTIHRINENSPASRAGLTVGDKVLMAAGQQIDHFDELVRVIQKHPGQKVRLKILRGRQILHKTVIPDSLPIGKDVRIGRIGIYSVPGKWPKNFIIQTRYSPFAALGEAFKKTGYMIQMSWHLLAKMVQGKLSWRYVSGPIGIAKGAGLSFEHGISSFLSFLALISVGLGFANLIPLPVLDGGYFLFYGVEWIIQRPFPKQVQQWYDRLGLIILLLLIALTFWNDLRFWN